MFWSGGAVGVIHSNQLPVRLVAPVPLRNPYSEDPPSKKDASQK